MSIIGAEILASQILRTGIKVKFRARGQSMYPFIRDGSILSIEPLCNTLPRKGEVIFCWYSTQTAEIVLVHRFLRYLPDGRVQTRGDHLPEADPPLPVEQVLGRVSRVEQANSCYDLGNPFWRIVGWWLATFYIWEIFFRKVVARTFLRFR